MNPNRIRIQIQSPKVSKCRERGDKRDKKISEEFFKLIRKIAQRSEAKRSEN